MNRNRVIGVVGILGLVVALASSQGANPCPNIGLYMGAVMSKKCESDTTNCSWLQWNYGYVRTCYYWCCYDLNFNNTGWLLSGCGPFVFDECCTWTGTSHTGSACPVSYPSQ